MVKKAAKKHGHELRDLHGTKKTGMDFIGRTAVPGVEEKAMERCGRGEQHVKEHVKEHAKKFGNAGSHTYRAEEHVNNGSHRQHPTVPQQARTKGDRTQREPGNGHP